MNQKKDLRQMSVQEREILERRWKTLATLVDLYEGASESSCYGPDRAEYLLREQSNPDELRKMGVDEPLIERLFGTGSLGRVASRELRGLGSRAAFGRAGWGELCGPGRGAIRGRALSAQLPRHHRTPPRSFVPGRGRARASRPGSGWRRARGRLRRRTQAARVDRRQARLRMHQRDRALRPAESDCRERRTLVSGRARAIDGTCGSFSHRGQAVRGTGELGVVSPAPDLSSRFRPSPVLGCGFR